MADLSALAPITTAAASLSGLIMVTPGDTQGYQPVIGADEFSAAQSPEDLAEGIEFEQPPPLLFHYEGEQSVSFESDITDHYVEDNSAVQDQISLKPVLVATHGFIGELNNIPPPALAILKSIANKLTAIVAYAPEVSETAQLAYNEAFFLYQTVANAASAAIAAWSSLFGDDELAVIGDNGLPGFNLATGEVKGAQNNQQAMFQQFFGYWKARKLFRVQTPWAVFENMAIASVRAIQAEGTEVISDFDVKFKQIRHASSLFTEGTPGIKSGQLNDQAAPGQDNGTSAATSNDASQDSAIATQQNGG